MRPQLARNMQILDNFISKYATMKSYKEVLNEPFVRFLCNHCQELMKQEPNIIELEGPINVCGDIHGRLSDLLNILNLGGDPSKTKYLFLGDYVDRGKKSVEVISLLLALKIKYPNNVHLLRGNHETKSMSKDGGFAKEVKKKLDKTLLKSFNDLFNSLPLAALINKKILAVHGGIAPELKTLDDIKNIQRFHEVPDTGLFSDILWTDPDPKVSEFGPSERGETFVFGLKPLEQFLADNNLEMLIRGHQVAPDGYNYPFYPKENIMTIFSCSSNDDDEPNKAAFVTFTSKDSTSRTINKLPIPTKKPSKKGKKKKNI